MKKILFIFILISFSFMAFGQRENTLPLKPISSASDSIRVVIDNQSSIQLRSVLQGALYDSLEVHTDTLQALRADIDAGGSSLLMDSITVHRTELNNLHDSIVDHRIDIDANLDSIGIHRTELNNAVDSLAVHRTEINANTSTGATNSGNISASSVFISVNAADIVSLEDSITKHTDTLQAHQDQIQALQVGGVSADSSWTSIRTDTITEFTTDQGVLVEGIHFENADLTLPTAGDRINFGTTNDIYIQEGVSTLQIAQSSAIKLQIDTHVLLGSGTHLRGWTDKANDLGLSSVFFRNTYTDSLIVGDDGNKIYLDGSNNLTFVDGVTPAKTLAELAASGTPWTKTGTNLSPTTSGDDILLDATERISFGDADSWIYESVDDRLVFIAGNTSSLFIQDDRLRSIDIDPFTTSTYDLGNTLTFWRELYVDEISVENTNTTISRDGSGNMTFVDGVTSSKTLAELADGGPPISHSLTDGAPTDAQIDAATGTTPAAVGSGWKRLILDSDGSGLMYIIISDGSSWQYTVMTIAL